MEICGGTGGGGSDLFYPLSHCLELLPSGFPSDRFPYPCFFDGILQNGFPFAPKL